MRVGRFLFSAGGCRAFAERTEHGVPRNAGLPFMMGVLPFPIRILIVFPVFVIIQIGIADVMMF